jgi:hypothetical protein
MKARSAICLAVGLVFTPAGVSRAGLIQILSPDAAYQGSSAVIPITGPDGTDLTSLTDGILTITFSHIREVHTVPGGGWNTWSSPPDSEDATPRVLSADNLDPSLSSLTLTFDRPLSTFGVEAEGELFDVRTFTATFFNGANAVGSFSRDIGGDADARLLAASATGGDLFTGVTIASDTDFALAQFRYGLTPAAAVPEPGGLTLFGLGVLGLWGYARRHRRAGPARARRGGRRPPPEVSWSAHLPLSRGVSEDARARH